ncbi:hypothetical protein CAEBREN_11274 [Caenorhabditis brenneri]|uniref:Uncharacterized protein n=1 Tax=Caenorhabditis brenneri TaxID=135651 RepID=G0M9V4_CAEBE|nr:hypothetical protein CAEBREN_11274 [Caenorhabditis brenneri]
MEYFITARDPLADFENSTHEGSYEEYMEKLGYILDKQYFIGMLFPFLVAYGLVLAVRLCLSSSQKDRRLSSSPPILDMFHDTSVVFLSIIFLLMITLGVGFFVYLGYEILDMILWILPTLVEFLRVYTETYLIVIIWYTCVRYSNVYEAGKIDLGSTFWLRTMIYAFAGVISKDMIFLVWIAIAGLSGEVLLGYFCFQVMFTNFFVFFAAIHLRQMFLGDHKEQMTPFDKLIYHQTVIVACVKYSMFAVTMFLTQFTKNSAEILLAYTVCDILLVPTAVQLSEIMAIGVKAEKIYTIESKLKEIS